MYSGNEDSVSKTQKFRVICQSSEKNLDERSKISRESYGRNLAVLISTASQ